MIILDKVEMIWVILNSWCSEVDIKNHFLVLGTSSEIGHRFIKIQMFTMVFLMIFKSFCRLKI